MGRSKVYLRGEGLGNGLGEERLSACKGSEGEKSMMHLRNRKKSAMTEPGVSGAERSAMESQTCYQMLESPSKFKTLNSAARATGIVNPFLVAGTKCLSRAASGKKGLLNGS